MQLSPLQPLDPCKGINIERVSLSQGELSFPWNIIPPATHSLQIIQTTEASMQTIYYIQSETALYFPPSLSV